MDWLKQKDGILLLIKRYKYVMAILLTGILLLMIPEKEKHQELNSPEQVQTNLELQDALISILKRIEGAGDVDVLLTEKQGEEIIYQVDANLTSGSNTESENQKTLIITDEKRAEKGLIRQVNPPVLQGAVVVCQGADDPKVKLAVVDAVMRATGLSSNQICVLKMK